MGLPLDAPVARHRRMRRGASGSLHRGAAGSPAWGPAARRRLVARSAAPLWAKSQACPAECAAFPGITA
eukprot:8543303-Pyramimonas_sp.AAC.1